MVGDPVTEILSEDAVRDLLGEYGALCATEDEDAWSRASAVCDSHEALRRERDAERNVVFETRKVARRLIHERELAREEAAMWKNIAASSRCATDAALAERELAREEAAGWAESANNERLHAIDLQDKVVEQRARIDALIIALERITQVEPPSGAHTDYAIYSGIAAGCKSIARAALGSGDTETLVSGAGAAPEPTAEGR